MGQWANGPMGQGAKGPMAQWANGPMGQWANGPMGQWDNGKQKIGFNKRKRGSDVNSPKYRQIIFFLNFTW